MKIVQFLKYTISGILLLTLWFACEKEESKPIISGPPPASERELETNIISDITGESYALKIYLPSAYNAGQINDLPVIYYVGGNVKDTFYNHTVSAMKSIGLNAILVTINDKNDASIIKDFSAEGCKFGSAEGFSQFRNFMIDQVVPYVDQNYKNDVTKRTLLGGGYGGSFVYNNFFRENPDNIVFNRFMALTPIICDSVVMQNHINNLNFSEDTQIKMYISSHSEDVNNIPLLHQLLDEQNFSFLELKVDYFPDEVYVTFAPRALREGFKYLYL